MRRLVSSDEAVPTEIQHTKACSDCPFARHSIQGWLGSMSADEWLNAAHGEATADCHITTNQQCAGMAIYRANICKLPRNRDAMRLPADRQAVFSNRMEFKEHHEG